MKGPGFVVALLLAALALPARAAQRRVAVVAEEDEPLRGAVVRDIGRPAGAEVTVLTFAREDLSDPIRRGELLARLAASDLVVPVGDAATDLVLAEIEDEPIYFVGAAVVPGKSLASPGVAGMLAYDPQALAAAAAKLWPGRQGLVYTPGYERVAAAVREAARGRGLELEERRVESAKSIPAALSGLFSRCRAVWLLGDPLLSRGAGFEFASERSLSLRVPLIGVDERAVRRGAFLGLRPDEASLAAAAAADVGALAASGKAPAVRVKTAPAAAVLVSGALSRAWGVKIPPEAGWRLVQ